ncbi:uncharacterized protein B0H18DRAFT_987879 [Fomitopsis serialis]|uniref:uncharacterized protein n=1 Tax=Fomitopsis serialis TaxID=139415 RepID=UPI0020085208|nr:uncharacterized protein B0H18DRAFT_987879 [Neoantrodia serialis]KAH9932378.1 hypothetical protein B0H18DRAFT_987879 [Neoantrodia serialis]
MLPLVSHLRSSSRLLAPRSVVGAFFLGILLSLNLVAAEAAIDMDRSINRPHASATRTTVAYRTAVQDKGPLHPSRTREIRPIPDTHRPGKLLSARPMGAQESIKPSKS